MRVASQLTFCSPQKILRRTVVEQDEQSTITRLFSLDQQSVESANTLFYDGIISAEFISVKELATNVLQLVGEYNYIDVSSGIAKAISSMNKPLILDFGTNSIEKINRQLPALAPALSGFSIFEIIAACCYFPAVVLGQKASLTVGRNTGLLLWEKTNLVDKRMIEQTQIRKIS
jgi:hypothetical protein